MKRASFILGEDDEDEDEDEDDGADDGADERAGVPRAPPEREAPTLGRGEAGGAAAAAAGAADAATQPRAAEGSRERREDAGDAAAPASMARRPRTGPGMSAVVVGEANALRRSGAQAAFSALDRSLDAARAGSERATQGHYRAFAPPVRACAVPRRPGRRGS